MVNNYYCDRERNRCSDMETCKIKSKNTGILLIHGFGGSVSEVEPLGAFLREKGFTVLFTRLSGHGGSRAELRRTSGKAWIESAQRDLDALRQEADQVFILGFSLGGLIAVNLAVDNPVAGIATLNSPIYCWHKRQILRNTAQDLRSGGRAHIRHYLESTVKFPWQTLLNFQRVLHTTKGRLSELRCPLFIAQGLLDDTASPRSGDYILTHAGSKDKRLCRYSASGHLICHEPDSEALFRDLSDFIEARL